PSPRGAFRPRFGCQVRAGTAAAAAAAGRTLARAMTPLFTVNLLRVLFVTFCGATGSLISGELQGSTMPGLLIGLLAGLIIVLIDRMLKGISLRAFSSATFGLLLGLIFADLLAASEVLRFSQKRRSG